MKKRPYAPGGYAQRLLMGCLCRQLNELGQSDCLLYDPGPVCHQRGCLKGTVSLLPTWSTASRGVFVSVKAVS